MRTESSTADAVSPVCLACTQPLDRPAQPIAQLGRFGLWCADCADDRADPAAGNESCCDVAELTPSQEP